MTTFLHLLGASLCAETCNDHMPLVRTARVRPITGHPVTGWEASKAS